MSEFRQFCLTFFISGGLLAAVDNHGIAEVSQTGLLAMSVFFATAVVGVFGKKGPRP